MKVIGLIGGMTWESTLEYYRIINETVKDSLGEVHSARCLLYSFDFAPLAILQEQHNWGELTTLLVDAAQTLEQAGAEVIVICANTMHRMANEVQKKLGVPLLNIIDVTAEEIVKQGLRRVGLLGTIFTMEGEFYKKRLSDQYGIDVMVPSKTEREVVNRIIYEELSLGRIKESSKAAYLKIMENLLANHAEGIILGCTEIPLLINQKDVDAPVFDTTTLHAKAAVAYAVS